ncbi:MAG: ABC transporter permease [Christensenellales bacterium]
MELTDNNLSFEKQNFAKQLKGALYADFKRAFTMPMIYIFFGICFLIPILIFVMTSSIGDGGADSFTNVWQAIGSSGENTASMSLTGMCNINLVFFFAAIYLSVFVSEDFKSGYSKNLFAVRSKKIDYVFSKTLLGFVCGTAMLSLYFVGAIIGGAIAGLSFETANFGAGGIASSVFAKIFLVPLFSALALLGGTIAKSKTWLSVLLSLAVSMLLFSFIPMVTSLNSTFLNVVLCCVGGIIFAVGLGAINCLILNKTDLA